MPTYASDVKPASTGLRLGNENQKWDAYIQDIFVDSIASAAPNAASAGFMRLASTDGIAWRNAANTADVTLSKTTAASSTTPADVLMFSGAGIESPIISHNLNPAAAGEFRLASSDVFNFRNNANNADVNALTHNTDDTLTVGGSAGIDFASGTVTGDLTVGGTVNAANIQRLDGVVNASQFGGIDMAAKINAAIASLGGGPGRVVVPTGTYSVATQIRKPKGIDLDLQGSTLNFAASAIPCIVCGDTSTSTTQFGGIRNGIINGVSAASNPYGIWLGGDSGGTNAPTNYVCFLESFTDLTVQNVAAGYTVGYKAYQISWFDGIIQQCTWGIQNSNQYYSENMNLHGTQIINNTGNALVIDAQSDFHCFGCSFDYNQGGAIQIQSGGLSFHGGNIEQLSGLIVNSPASINGLIVGFYNTRMALTNASGSDTSFLHIEGTNSNLMCQGVHLTHLHTVTEFVNWQSLGTVNGATIDFHDDSSTAILATNAAPNLQYLRVSTPFNSQIVGRVPIQMAAVDAIAQTGAITTTTLFTPTLGGMYRLLAYLKITTAGTSPVIGPVTITYTDATDSVAQSVVMALTKQDGTVGTSNNGNTTTSTLAGSLPIWAKSGVAIGYAIALTGTVGAGVYEAHLRLESM